MAHRYKRLLQGILLLAFAMVVFTPVCTAQTKKIHPQSRKIVAQTGKIPPQTGKIPLNTPKVTARPKKQFTVLVGGGIPLSREGLRQFWKVGPSGSLSFFVNVSSATALGIGADVSMLYFRLGTFASTFPGVSVQPKDVAMIHVYVGVKHSFAPTKRFSPYVVATVGAARVTAATYKEVVDSVRVTYYDIPGRTRLAGSLGLGTDISLSTWLSFTMEAKATYFNNDADVGFECLVRGGFRFTLR